MAAHATLSSLSDTLATRRAGSTVMMYRDERHSFWREVGGRYAAAAANSIARAMLRAGVRHGDRVIILADNMPECIYTSLAAYRIGVTVVPLFAATTAAVAEAAVRLTEARLIFVGGQEQYDIAIAVCGKGSTTLRGIVAFDPDIRLSKGDRATKRLSALLANFSGSPLRLPYANASDTADIIFTSGTMGEPRGVEITHAMYEAGFEANARVVRLTDGWKALEYLPYSHVFERAWAMFCLRGGLTLAINRRPSHLQRSLREVRPEAMCCVPHFWEKLHQAVEMEKAKLPAAERQMVSHSLEVGRRRNVEFIDRQLPVPEDLEREYRECDARVLGEIRRRAGLENARLMPTAGATVTRQTVEFARACGLPILVGYGLTETTATVSCDDFGKPRTPGSAGRPISPVELRFGERDEIQLRGATIARGYFRNPGATRQCFDSDGWFMTGDAGHMENGELFITGRIKMLMKTSNGKYVSPERLESMMNADPAISQSVVVAEGRKFVGALIVASPLLSQSAHSPGEARKIIGEHIGRLQADVPPYSRVKRFVIIGEPLTVANGCLTSTLKVRREAVAKRFASEIETIYDNRKYALL